MSDRYRSTVKRAIARRGVALVGITALITPTTAVLLARPATATQGIINTIAGNGTAGYNGDGIPATSAEFGGVHGVAVDAEGNQLVGDAGNSRVRVVAVSASNPGYPLSGCSGACTWTVGDIYTIAGAGPNNFVAIDAKGNPIISDNARVRVVAVSASNPGYVLGGCSGACTWTMGGSYTIAGNGGLGYTGDGIPATSALLNGAAGITVDAEGNVYLADNSNNRVRVVAVSATNPGLLLGGCSGTCTWIVGDIYTIAGNGGNVSCCHYNGDGIPATSAEVASPNGVAVDSGGNVLVTDTGNERVRVVAVAASNPGYVLGGCSGGCPKGSTWTVGDIYTIAGNGIGGYNGDGIPATSAELFTLPVEGGVAADAEGNPLITDTYNERVRVVAVSASNPGYVLGGCSGGCPTGSTWTVGDIYTIAGGAAGGYNGDGIPATSAALGTPQGVAVDAQGDFYFADSAQARVREVSAPRTTAPLTEHLENPSPINLGSFETVTATVQGNAIAGAPTGSVTFYVCGPTATSCDNTGHYVGTVSPLTAGWGANVDNASATLPAPGYSPTSTGTWCFSAYYTSNEPAVYSGVSDSGTSDGCFTVNGTPPVYITAAGGTPQSNPLNSPLGQDLVASVTDQNANPVAGTAVQFTVNGSANGASGSFSAAGSTCGANGVSSPSATEYFALTDSAGYARVPATCFITDGISGSYYVTASLDAGPTNATTTFGLSNTAGTGTPCSGAVTTHCTVVIDTGSIPGSLGLSFTSIPDYARPSGGCTVANAESTQTRPRTSTKLLNAIPPGNDAKPVEVNFDAGMCYVLDGTVYMRGLQHVILNGNGATFVQVPGETVSLTVGGGTTAQGVVTPGSFVSDDSVHLTQAYHYNGTNQAIPVTGHGIPAGTFVGTVVGTTAGATYPYIAGFTLVDAVSLFRNDSVRALWPDTGARHGR